MYSYLPPSTLVWRFWGAAGACLTLVAYIVEYAPRALELRLEVNHPLYALAWLGAGECLSRAALLDTQSDPRTRRCSGLIGVLALAAAVAPAILIWTLGDRVFLPSNTFLHALHSSAIAEFQTLPHLLAGREMSLDLAARLLPSLLVVLAVIELPRARISPDRAIGAGISVAAAVMAAALAILQIRWLALSSALSVLAASVVIRSTIISGSGPRRALFPRTFALLTLSICVVSSLRSARLANLPTETDVRRLAERDIAHRLRIRVGENATVIAGAPEATTSLIFYSGGSGLGTLYWENIHGLQRAARILAATQQDAAHDLTRASGVTHFVILPWDTGDLDYVRLEHPPDEGASVTHDALANQLRSGRAPSWLKPIPHRLPPHPVLNGSIVRIYEVVPHRSPPRVLVDQVTFLVEMDRMAEADSLAAALQRNRDDLSSQAVLALLQARRRDNAGFSQTLQRMLPLLDQSVPLDLEHRIPVIMALAIAGREALAVEEIRSCFSTTSAAEARCLPAGMASDLRTLSEALGVVPPGPEFSQALHDASQSAAR